MGPNDVKSSSESDKRRSFIGAAKPDVSPGHSHEGIGQESYFFASSRDAEGKIHSKKLQGGGQSRKTKGRKQVYSHRSLVKMGKKEPFHVRRELQLQRSKRP